MMVRGGRAQVRQTAQKPKTYQTYSFAAPTTGWVANGNLAAPQPGGATILENWFPTSTGAKMRRGSDIYATLGDASLPVAALFTYSNGNQEEMFGATSTTIYDITTITSPVNYIIATEDGDPLETDTGDTMGQNSTEGLDVLTGLTGGDWSVVQFETAGGSFLRGVNGKDTPFVYDGTTWGTSPAITGVVPEDLSFVWSFKNRLFFIQKESLNAWYLPVDSIGGAAVKFPLGGEFSLGGSLVFGASWSRDAGDGMNAMCAFFSSEGEVAVYQGSDPGSATTWSQVGVYRIGKPLGPKAFIPAGGDLVIATTIGFVPLSQAVQRDYAALSPAAVSSPIETEWNEAVRLRSSAPWHAIVWSEGQMMVIALPSVNDQPPMMLVANTLTGKWAPFSNWDGTCLCTFKGRLFFGSEAGKVIEANVSGLDQGLPYTATFVPLFDQLGVPGRKTASMARAVLRASTAIRERLSIQTDYDIKLPPVPDAAPVEVVGVWDGAVWGESVWGEQTPTRTQQNWRSVYGTGDAIAPGIQITSGSIAPLDVEIIRFDVAFEPGDVIS